jgi:hypothetical protein
MLKKRKEVLNMDHERKQLNREARYAMTVELHELAMAFRITGRVDTSRWSPEAVAGLGSTLFRLGQENMQQAKAVAKQSADWALQSLGK